MTKAKKSDLHAKVQFCTYVLATTANLPDFLCRRRLDDVSTTLLISRRFARDNFTSGRRRRPYCLKKDVPHTGGVVPSPITVQVRILEPGVDGFLYSLLKPLRFYYSQQLCILQIYHVSKAIKVNVAGDLRCGRTGSPMF